MTAPSNQRTLRVKPRKPGDGKESRGLRPFQAISRRRHHERSIASIERSFDDVTVAQLANDDVGDCEAQRAGLDTSLDAASAASNPAPASKRRPR